MAVTITQSPNRFNLAYQPNVWTLSGLLSSEDGYGLVVRDRLNQTIAIIKQPANPAGVAHFDISKILQSQLGTAFYETTQKVAETPGEAFEYSVSYGTYTDGAYSSDGTSARYFVYNGYDDWRNLNWNDTPFNPSPLPVLCDNGPVDNAEYSGSTYSYLTNYPNAEYPLRSSSYHTLGFMNKIKNYDSGPNWDLNVQPAFVRIRFYDQTDNLIQTAIYSITAANGLGPRPDYNSTSIPNYNNDQYVGVVGAGPQNLKDAGLWPSSTGSIWNQVTQTWGNMSVIWNLATSSALVDHYIVDIMSIDACEEFQFGPPPSDNATDLEPYLGDVIYTWTFKIDDPCSKFEDVTVSFLNQYGVKDYFTFDRRNTYNVNTKRQEYFKTNGSWSASSFAIDQHSGGSTVFSSDITTNMTLSSNWMDDATSKWLEELYTSPQVQVYYDGEWHPAVITTSRYEQKNYSRNKLFQHNLEIKFANKKRVQRG